MLRPDATARFSDPTEDGVLYLVLEARRSRHTHVDVPVRDVTEQPRGGRRRERLGR